ncbi:MAG TPA: D-arabinose 5-phosphate isomerase, partial [Candidatus Sphingobacterium stercoripullorum]|nr:D-arabinose 5-phosphate isomerase [Candidatus Sphingobacterium stercoripullorum]
MINNNEILESAIQTIEMESKAILNLKNKLNYQFIEVVKYILTLNGRVVVTGIGKSAIIGQKIV